MLNQTQVTEIATRRENGEGLNAIIESMGLNVQATLIDLKNNHRTIMDEAKQKQRDKAVV